MSNYKITAGPMYMMTKNGFQPMQPHNLEVGKCYYKGATIPASVIYITRLTDDKAYYLFLSDQLYHSSETVERCDSRYQLEGDVSNATSNMTEQRNLLDDSPLNKYSRDHIDKILAGDPSGYDVPETYTTFEEQQKIYAQEAIKREEYNKRVIRYSLTDTAKLVREALKTNFPGVKFSVRSNSYSGGSSIDVGWIDGPTSKQVEEITNHFEGATFDGMTDLKSYHDSVDSKGNPVRYNVDFIFENRKYSEEFLLSVAAGVVSQYDYTLDDVKIKQEYSGEGFYIEANQVIGDGYILTLRDAIIKAAQETSAFVEAKQSAPIENKPQTNDKVKIGEYKGHPTITLLSEDKEFSFGKAKAKLILENIEAIHKFVEEN